jgi:hypothetical protein
LLNFCFVGIRLSDQIKDDVQKAGVAEVPEINVLIEQQYARAELAKHRSYFAKVDQRLKE